MTPKAGQGGGSQRDTAPRATRAERLAAQRKAVEDKARRRITAAIAIGVVVAIAGVVVAVVVSGSGTKKAAASGAQDGGKATCAYTAAGAPAKDVGLPPATGVAARAYHAVIATSQGDLGVDLDGSAAPCTVNSFVYLAGKGYFDNTSCHRLTTSGIFVLQCGDPTGTGGGGPGYRFADENLAGATYPAGTLAMANAGPGTNGSQFFVVYADTTLPPNYTPFGKVTSGLDVVRAVAAKGTDDANGLGDGHPKLPVKINAVTVSP